MIAVCFRGDLFFVPSLDIHRILMQWILVSVALKTRCMFFWRSVYLVNIHNSIHSLHCCTGKKYCKQKKYFTTNSDPVNVCIQLYMYILICNSKIVACMILCVFLQSRNQRQLFSLFSMYTYEKQSISNIYYFRKNTYRCIIHIHIHLPCIRFSFELWINFFPSFFFLRLFFLSLL